ncbi:MULTISPECIES: alkaline shock response membrane anchor protein AmaP [unclassified Brevibacterium]|uniref:alkaline shock response membrane anchor protein AmaP n=1 Tax=unclassified Brevibacterium TaxID=2614124 RepID=UPI0010F7E7A7|nr:MULTISPECIES: alkaline shock response membrane anchor protein AmaP [unclassified Brevibacterium]MCM1011132.1 alkaline shock response membrane anchor protein AmaP [Brevibacterium sp. XM4083]
MRRMAAGANRTLLFIVGLVCLIVGAGAAAAGFGFLSTIIAGLEPSSTLGVLAVPFTWSFSALVAVLIAVVLAIIGIWWLSLQIPRKDAAKPLRLQQDARTGLTTVTANVIAEAVADDLETIEGVDSAQVIVRGTARRPELVIHIDVDDRADIDAIVAEVADRVARNASSALGEPLAAVGLEIGIARTPNRKQRSVTLA